MTDAKYGESDMPLRFGLYAIYEALSINNLDYIIQPTPSIIQIIIQINLNIFGLRSPLALKKSATSSKKRVGNV